jgi:hypothetical protein
MAQRIAAFAFVFLIGVWAIGELLVSPSSKNVVANHGGIGLVIGAVTAVAMFFDICFDNAYAAASCLSGPFLGAFFGMLVGGCRRLIDKRFNRPERVAEQPPPA